MPTSLEEDGSQRVIGAIDGCGSSIYSDPPSRVKRVAQNEHTGMTHGYFHYNLIGLVPQYRDVGTRISLW